MRYAIPHDVSAEAAIAAIRRHNAEVRKSGSGIVIDGKWVGAELALELSLNEIGGKSSFLVHASKESVDAAISGIQKSVDEIVINGVEAGKVVCHDFGSCGHQARYHPSDGGEVEFNFFDKGSEAVAFKDGAEAAAALLAH